MPPFEGPLPPFDLRADYWSLRFVEETAESYAVRKNVPQPLAVLTDRGVMATVYADGGYGYAATSDLSPAGLAAVLQQALAWARATARLGLFDTRTLPRPNATGAFRSPALDAPQRSRREWYEWLSSESQAAAIDPRIVDWEMSIESRLATHRLVTSAGGDVVQRFRFLFATASATAHANGDTQTRTLGGSRSI
jgi:predicted Zn-dependent protease